MGFLSRLFRKNTEEERVKEELIDTKEKIKNEFYQLIEKDPSGNMNAVYREIPFDLITANTASDYLVLLDAYKLALKSNIPLYDCNLAMLKLNQKARSEEAERRKILDKELSEQLNIITFKQ